MKKLFSFVCRALSAMSSMFAVRHFILVKETSSEVFLSKSLFDSIQHDHPGQEYYRVLFSRFSGSQEYVMFFNPEWEKHGVSNPNFILTIPVTVGKNGHVGFQSVQPTMSELCVMYGISTDDNQAKRLKVSRHMFNGEPYYRIHRP